MSEHLSEDSAQQTYAMLVTQHIQSIVSHRRAVSELETMLSAGFNLNVEGQI